jgi:hypothetical protein
MPMYLKEDFLAISTFFVRCHGCWECGRSEFWPSDPNIMGWIPAMDHLVCDLGQNAHRANAEEEVDVNFNLSIKCS